MSIFDIKPIKYNDGTILYKGKKYANENDPNLINQLNIDRQNKINAQRNRLQSRIQPNSIVAPEMQAKAAAELANLNGLQNAKQFEGRKLRTVEDIVLNRMPPKVDNTPAGLLGITTPNVNINANSILPVQPQSVQSQPVQSAQPQPKRTLGQRASGLFDRVSDAYMGAAPIFAVAQEFQKAGALRPIGEPMQGDPYGKMMQIQQGRQQAENLAQLREQYPQFANLSDKNFEEVITSLAKEGKLNIGNQLQQTEEQRDASQLRNIKNSMQTGDADAALSYGAIDRLAGGISSVTGKVGLPLKKYQRANTATEGFIRDAMNASRANFDGRQTNLLFEFIREEMPEPNMNEQQALERTKTVYRRFDDAITGYEQLLDDPNSNLTTSQRGNISKALKLYEGVRDRALVRIKSIEDVISSSKLEKAAGESVYEAPEVSDTNLDTSEINEWNNSLSIREQIQ